jgi:branched-chain amino acid transport system substrate-binding protein
VKKSAADYVTKYEQKFGVRTTFGGHLWTLTCCSRRRSRGARKAKPGTPQFRAALRDALENATCRRARRVRDERQRPQRLDNRARVMIRSTTASGSRSTAAAK